MRKKIELQTNKVSEFQETPTNTAYPTEKLTKDSLDGKQATLVSGTNIKTINSESILGEGDLEISGGVDHQVFTSDGTWTKPDGATAVEVQVWGGGGSGAASRSDGDGCRSTGGGGGAYNFNIFNADDLGATETIIVGLGGDAVVPGAGASAASNPGNAGGLSRFGTKLYAYGGGAGGAIASHHGITGNGVGGGGGGQLSAGGNGIGHVTSDGHIRNAGLPGCPVVGASTLMPSDVYAAELTKEIANGITGGGAGGGSGEGGNSYNGGAGGGMGNQSSSYDGGVSVHGGNGGDASSGGIAAQSGSIPGGGGGGYADGDNQNGDSGAGGRGEVRVTTYF